MVQKVKPEFEAGLHHATTGKKKINKLSKKVVDFISNKHESLFQARLMHVQI